MELPRLRVLLHQNMVVETFDWLVDGMPDPAPDIVKKLTVLNCARAYNCVSFVETGTFMATTTKMMADQGFDVTTIELSPQLHEAAVLKMADHKNVRCLQGDSGILLGQVVNTIRHPALYWLDGHYSGGQTAKADTETPLLRELWHIFGSDVSQDVVLIDDVRCLGQGDYPSMSFVLDLVKNYMPNHTVSVFHDIMRIAPKR
jgi:hypothetical protein